MHRLRMTAVLSLLALAFLVPRAADAGCGCAKPPPPPAAIRPNFAYAGGTVIVFDRALEPGSAYEVEFRSRKERASATTSVTAELRKDQADGIMKPQLRVEVPPLPMGPASIRVKGSGNSGNGEGGFVLIIEDGDFTIIAGPVVFPSNAASLSVRDYRTGVGEDGTVYFAFDLSNVSAATVFGGLAAGLPFRLVPEDVVFYNAQGFFFESLDVVDPAIYAISDGDDGNQGSDVLAYWRHEFATYQDRHQAGGLYAPSGDDPDYWHADGTPHIDHDNVILAIPAALRNGSDVEAGRSPAFTLHLETVN